MTTFGEIMLRLAPPVFLRFSQANSFEVYGELRITCKKVSEVLEVIKEVKR